MRSTGYLIGTLSLLAGAVSLASSVDARSKKQVQGYGNVSANSVTLARVKPVEKTLKGCGLNLGGLIGTVSARGRQTFGQRCDPRKKERQPFGVWRVSPGQSFEVAMRTNRPISQASFGGRQSLRLNLPKGDSRSCYVIGTVKGNSIKLVPVRTDRSDLYYFSNPLAASAYARDQALAEEKRTKQKMDSDLSRHRAAFSRLRGNRAYSASRKACFMPQQRSIPPKPRVMSYSEAQFQGRGACTSRLMQIWNKPKVTQALRLSDSYDILDAHKKWERSGRRPSSCASNASQKEVTELGQGLGSFFTGGFQNLSNSQVRSGVNRCINAVINSCRSGLRSWQSRVNNIRSEPQKSFNSCTADRRTVNGIASSWGATERAYNQASARVQNLPSSNGAVDLANARCRPT